MPDTTRPALCLLLIGGVVFPAAAGQTATNYGVDVSVGYDSNPLLVMDEGPGGAFTHLRVDGGLTHHVGTGATAAFFVNGNAATRLNDSGTADAGFDSGGLRAGMALSPGFAGHRFMMTTGARLGASRTTFTDRATGAVYEANAVPATDPPTTILIGERLDVDSLGAFLDMRFKQSDRITWSVETAYENADFVEDYGQTTSLDPLDYESVTVRPGASVRIGNLTTLGAFVSLTDLDYEARPALDKSGAEVPGTTRTYRYAQYQMTVSVAPARAWNLNVGLIAGGRDDTYAGYYDSTVRSGFVGLERTLGAYSRISVVTSIRDIDYDQATVTGDPGSDIRRSDGQRYLARFDRRFGKFLRWYAEGGTETADSRDPVFAFDRNWFLSGFRYGR